MWRYIQLQMILDAAATEMHSPPAIVSEYECKDVCNIEDADVHDTEEEVVDLDPRSRRC